jgi:glyoxylase-like metal-dependent hydrolase (beta-lactamase superfamily II)
VCEQRYSRRQFLGHASSCVAHLGIMSAMMPLRARQVWAAQERFPVVASEPWGRIERISDGIWALVSTPLQDRTTLCNGGIIAGRSGVAVIEAFGSDAGARWMAERAVELTGQAPTHVILTHFHSDHTGGLRGARESSAPAILATPVTRDWTRQNEGAPNDILNRAIPLDTIRPTELDLGGRSVVIVPRRGHTDSDVTIEISDPSVVFCGDLVWNGMFPNYRDATPSRLSQAVRLMRATEAWTYVPGHGALADTMAVDRYIDLLDDVEAAARRALEKGMTAEEAGAEYRLPAAMANWTRFREEYFATAIGAWLAELQGP